MATSLNNPVAGDMNTEKDSCRKNSTDFDRPYLSGVSQVNIMLMSQSAEGQRSAGNIILGKEAFTVSETQKSERHDGLVAGRHLAVITTADLFKSNLSEEERSQGVRRCLGLSAPGPHVFLWVQQEKTITQEDRDTLRRFKQSFGEEASKYSMVLFMHEDYEEYSAGDLARLVDDTLQDFIQDCGGRYHLHSQRNHTQVTELLEKIQEIVDGNRGSSFTQEIPKWPDDAGEGLESKKEKEGSREELGGTLVKQRGPSCSRSKSVNIRWDTRDYVRMVLVGRTGVGKSATGNTILGREVFTSKAQMYSVTKKCQKQTGNVAGRRVAVIDTPGLFDTTLSSEDIQHEIMNCMSLAFPGPHVFLLVMSVGRFSQEERQTLKLIKNTFGDKAEKYSIVLFTRADDLNDQSIHDYISEGDPEVIKLIEDCGGRYHIFNNREKKDRHQVINLFKMIEQMNWENGGSSYTHEMFMEAEKTMLQLQMKRELETLEAKYKTKIENINRKVVEERQLQERERKKKDELIKLMQREKLEKEKLLEEREREKYKFKQQEWERAEKCKEHKINFQDKDKGKLLGPQALLDRKAGDEKGREGASGTWRPEKHDRQRWEDGKQKENRRQFDWQGSEKTQGMKEDREDECLNREKNEEVRLIEEKYKRLLQEMREKYEEQAKQQADKSFINQESGHSQAKKKEKLCVIL